MDSIAIEKHREWQGKISVEPRAPLNTKAELAIAYTPGVAEPCLAIQSDYAQSFSLTRRGNLVAVITDGTAVLGLGDIGPEAGMPVMEGKCCLFKKFGNVDAFPLCIRSKDVDEIVRTIYLLSGSFGGINLEDIAAPRCFEIERRLKEICDIPIFHDDQHGTAVVTLAALINALRVVKKEPNRCKVAISGAGAAGIAIADLLLHWGITEILLTDRKGILYDGKESANEAQKSIAKRTNPKREKGTLADALQSADIFIGVSAKGLVTSEMVSKMADGAIVFAMANPTPEIFPADAMAGGAAVVGTGRSDFKNQINNVLVFPGIFRGALDVRASDINVEMKMAAAEAIASLVSDEELSASFIIPDAIDPRVGPAVAKAVADAAIQTGVARI